MSKAIDKAAGVEREVVDTKTGRGARPRNDMRGGQYGSAPSAIDTPAITAPATDAAKQWAGWGTALKPAWEPIIVARKPLVGTVAANVLKHGTGALNIDACRIEAHDSQLEEKYTTSRTPGRATTTSTAPTPATGQGRHRTLPGAGHRTWCSMRAKPPNLTNKADLDNAVHSQAETRKRAKFDGRIYAGGNEYVGELTDRAVRWTTVGARRGFSPSSNTQRRLPVMKDPQRTA